MAGPRSCVELQGREMEGGTTKEGRHSEGKREGNRKTGVRFKKMERSGKPSVQCGFDFNCQSSVILLNQSHMR